MIIVNNKSFIINEINKKTDKAIAKLREDNDKQIEELRLDHKTRLDKQIKELKQKQTKELNNLEKQQKSSYELQSQIKLLSKKSDLFTQIVNDLKQNVFSLPKKDQLNLIKSMINKIDAHSNVPIKKYQVPKGLTVTGKKCEDTLSDFIVVGYASQTEVFEITLEEMLNQNAKVIQKIIDETIA